MQRSTKRVLVLGLMSGIVLAALVCLFGGESAPSSAAAQDSQSPAVAWRDPLSKKRRGAVDKAYRWLVARTTSKKVLLLHGSDFLQLFYELKSSAASPELRRRAERDGRALAKRNLALMAKSKGEDIGALSEGIALLSLVPEFGLEVGALRRKVKVWRANFTDSEVYEIEKDAEARSSDELCDALISLHFLRRARLPDDDTLAWVLELCARHIYRSEGLSEEELLDQDNLMSHVIYVLSDYGRLRLDRRRFRREEAYALQSLVRCRKGGDIEGVAEFTDSLRILGYKDGHPEMGKSLNWILERQQEDGSFGNVKGDFYERYHSTWTALNALRGFRFAGSGPLWKEWKTLRPLATSDGG